MILEKRVEKIYYFTKEISLTAYDHHCIGLQHLIL